MGKLTVDLSGQWVKLPPKLRLEEPSHASRYWIIAQILNSLVSSSDKVVDVGGKEGLLRSFGYEPTVIDIEASQEPNFVQGNALEMPFQDKKFKVSVSCDVLEHIESNDRGKFISEMLRVSDIAIICAPFNHAGMLRAESEINEYYKKLLKQGHRWLEEHIDNGLPSEAQTEEMIKKLGYHNVQIRHFSLDLWTKILKAHLLHAAFGDSKQIPLLTKKLYEKYYNELCCCDFSNFGYRTFFIITKDEIELKLPGTNEITARKREFIDAMTDLLLEAIENQMVQIRKIETAKKNLRNDLKQAEFTLAELEKIKESKSWRLARKMSSIKHLGK